ncbi:DUF7503 family protein [Halovenus carboxidivorans]
MSDSTAAEFLKEHPRLLAALFGMTMLMAQVGPAVAGNGKSISGI